MYGQQLLAAATLEAALEVAASLSAGKYASGHYKSAYNSYEQAMTAMSARALPVDDDRVQGFIVYYVLAQQNKVSSAESTVSRLYGYVVNTLGSANWQAEPPSGPMTRQLLANLRAYIPDDEPRKVEPIRQDAELRALYQLLSAQFSESAGALQRWCMYLAMHQGLLRAGDITGGCGLTCDWKEEVDDDGRQLGVVMDVVLDKNNKRDLSTRRNKAVYVPRGDEWLDAPATMRRYADRLGLVLGSGKGLLFPELDGRGRPTGGHYTPKALLELLRCDLLAAGVAGPERYGTHSFRGGGRTDAVEASGGNYALADFLGRWRNQLTSNVGQGYTRLTALRMAGVLAAGGGVGSGLPQVALGGSAASGGSGPWATPRGLGGGGAMPITRPGGW